MSTQADPGTSTSETTITYPESKRIVKKDSRGNIISETKMGEEEKKKEPETTQVKTEEKTVEKEVQKKLPETEKETEKEKTTEEKETIKEKKEGPITEPQQQNDKTGPLETQVKQLSNRLDKVDKTVKWYRRDMISTAINNAHWLKPEQKEERINRYEEMDIHGEDLKLALTDAFGPQMAVARGASNPERKSSEQYHEDTFTGSNNNEVKGSGNEKLTLDLLQRNRNK
jgi:vancomycin resistance protein YoaR